MAWQRRLLRVLRRARAGVRGRHLSNDVHGLHGRRRCRGLLGYDNELLAVGVWVGGFGVGHHGRTARPTLVFGRAIARKWRAARCAVRLRKWRCVGLLLPGWFNRAIWDCLVVVGVCALVDKRRSIRRCSCQFTEFLPRCLRRPRGGYCECRYNPERWLTADQGPRLSHWPHKRVPRLVPQGSLLVALLGDQRAAPDALPVYEDLDRA